MKALWIAAPVFNDDLSIRLLTLGKNMMSKARVRSRYEPSISILLIDDEVVIRAGLRVLIDSWPNSHVVGEADSPAQALSAIHTVRPNLIICSYGKRLRNLDEIRKLTESAGPIPVVLLTGSRNGEWGDLAVQAGVTAFVSTKYGPIDLHKALERIHAGKESIAKPEVNGQSVVRDSGGYRLNDFSLDHEKRLTNREREVAALVSKGYTNKRVGQNLGITEVTVRHHLTSIFNKLRIANRFELIARFYRQGLINPVDIV